MSNYSNSSRKRSREAAQKPPAFCDATASVSATQFGARRLPEIKALWRTLQGECDTTATTAAAANGNSAAASNSVALVALQSGGRKTSSRHLRRRATSHKGRNATKRRHCCPRARNTTISYPPNISETQANSNNSSNAADVKTVIGEQAAAASVPNSRRARRQKSNLLQREHETWRSFSSWNETASGASAGNEASDNNATEDDTPPNATSNPLEEDDDDDERLKKANWMMTHVWHAKRFRMEQLWGWKVPVMHSNRGCAAALRLAREKKCLVQDATWCMQPIVWFRVSSQSGNDSQGDAASSTASALLHFQRNVARILPAFCTATAAVDAHGSTSVSGEGMLHQMDCFPSAAVGPVSWIWTRRPLVRCIDGDLDESSPSSSFVYFFAHPSLRRSAMTCFEAIANGEPSTPSIVQGPYSGIKGGVACLKLRGSSAVECLEKGLRSKLVDDHDLDSPAWIHFVEGACDQAAHGSVFLPPKMSTKDTDTSLLPTLVRCIRPRDPTMQTNWAVCGLDVFCDPANAKMLFQTLILSGGACPIGIAEDAYLSLECDPPLPVFPRDYPDTAEGATYWDANSEAWNCVRKYWEGGGGRISTTCETNRSPPLSWNDLTSDNKDEMQSESSVVVVRGLFGDPFRSAISGCATLPAPVSDGANLRRKRRPVGCTRPFVEAPKLSDELFSAHKDACTSLSQALVLPAALLCHVQIAGKGTLAAGSCLYPLDNTDCALGIVTTGAFSVARGRYHGIAIVGAARLLQAVTTSRSIRSCVVITRLDGTKELHLKVRSKNSCSALYEATLSLLGSH